FFSSRRRHTRWPRDWSSDVCSSDLDVPFLNSGILQYNIVLSELWANPGEAIPTQAEMNAAAEAQTFLAGQSYPAALVGLRTKWRSEERRVGKECWSGWGVGE